MGSQPSRSYFQKNNFVTALSSLSIVIPMVESLRIGLVGANYGSTLASGFLGLEGVSLVGMADKDPATLESASKALSIPNTFESLDELLADGQLDALLVATPTHLHERHTLAAFDRGIHVLCAAPIGVRESEISHISTSAGLVGKVFMYANPLRFDARIREAHALIKSGKAGTPFSASGCIQISDWPYPGSSWRLERDLGGGALLEAGTLSLDALWFAMGAPDPMEAMAARFDSFSASHASDCEHPAEDTLAGFVRFKDGTSLSFSSQIRAPIPVGETRRSLEIVATEGSFDLENGTRVLSTGNSEDYAETSDEASAYRALAEQFVDAVKSGEAPEADGKQALALHKMIDGLLKSSREKEAVSIKVERSLDDLFGGF